MKAVSTIIAIILIVMIVVALVSFFWIFSFGMFSSVTQTGTSSISHITEVMSSCMRIESIYQNKIYLRNCGQTSIDNNSLNVYIDDIPFSFNMTPTSISSNGLATLSMPIWGITLGTHMIRVSSPNVELTKTVESVLSDSAVLALDFDEGPGTTVNDKSDYGNNGTLYNSPNVTWNYDCKFAGCLAFNSTGMSTAGRVEIPNSQSLNTTGNQITVAAWVRPYNATPGNPYGTVIWKPGAWGFGSDKSITNPQVQFYINNSTGYQVMSWSNYANALPFNTWSYLTLIYNGSAVSIYINGILDKSNSTISGSIAINTNNVFIGQRTDLDRAFNGTIDSVRIYNKALTPDETVILKLK